MKSTKDIMNEVDDKLLLHYEFNYVNNLKKQLTEANEEIEKLQLKVDLLSGKKIIEKDKNAKEIEIKGYYTLYKEANEKLEKIKEYTISHYVTDNPVKFKNDVYDIIKGSDIK